MNRFIEDRVIGKLIPDIEGYTLKKAISISLFGIRQTVDLIVRFNEGINDTQRASYGEFSTNQQYYEDVAEKKLYDYFLDRNDLIDGGYDDLGFNELSQVMTLTSVVIPKGVRCSNTEFGFMGDFKLDPEHGFGILFIDGAVDDVGNSDMLL